MPTSTITNSFDGKLFTLKDSSKARTLQMIANFNKINLEIIYVKDTADFKETNNFNDSFPLGKLPAYQSNDGFNLHQSDAIAHYLASKEGSKLNGTNAKEKCLIQQWSEFANVEFESTRAVLLFPMFGWTTANVQFEKKAIENLNLSLEVLNEHLLNNTFLVGERITLADIKLCSSLLDFFKFYFNDAFTSKFKCLTRWFNTIANQDYVKEVIGSTKYHKLKEIDSKPFKSDSNQIALGKELEGKNTAETDTLKTNLKKKSEKQEESLRNQNQTVLNKKKFTYIVEHMEENITDWVKIEYLHMVDWVGKNNLLITHCDDEVMKNLPKNINGTYFDVLNKQLGIEKKKVILLDPKAKEELKPSDAENFDYLLFGGILGTDPPADRTAVLRKMGFACRKLGPVQLPTDQAVIFSHLILEKKFNLEEIKYVDSPEIKTGTSETVSIPMRFYSRDGKNPVLAPGLKELLKSQNDFEIEF